MKYIFAILSICLFLSHSAFAAKGPGSLPTTSASVELMGTVQDMLSGEVLGGVEVSIIGTQIHSYTDFDGRFNIEGLTPGVYDIVVSYISYEKSLIEKIEVKQGESSPLNIRLISTR